jgi:hypothetical protein
MQRLEVICVLLDLLKLTCLAFYAVRYSAVNPTPTPLASPSTIYATDATDPAYTRARRLRVPKRTSYKKSGGM